MSERVDILGLVPKEVLLHIISFLDAKFVVDVLSKVNWYLHSVIGDPFIFRQRIKKRWPGRSYPPIGDKLDVDWHSACVAREEQTRLWSNPEENFRHFRLKTAQSVSVDAVLATHGLVVSGSRDRSVAIWSLRSLLLPEADCDPVQKLHEAHDGWIWSLSCYGDTLLSGAWDTTVHQWDITPTGIVKRSSVTCKTAVLTTTAVNDIFCVGTFDKKVVLFDNKTNRRLGTKRYHQMPVLALSAASDYIISASEDRTIVFFDRKAEKRIETLRFEEFPMSLARRGDILYVGDKSGGLHLIDVQKFRIVKSYSKVHSSKLTGVVFSEGSVITCSSDASIKVYHPDLELEVMEILKIPEDDEITGISFLNGVLVSGHNSCVQVWQPKE